MGTEDKPFDYFHGNSVSVDEDGSLLVNARNTHAFYNLDRETGEVNWTAGGPESDFELGDGVYFAWQHDVERQADGSITMFDNQSSPTLGDSSTLTEVATSKRTGFETAIELPEAASRSDDEDEDEDASAAPAQSFEHIVVEALNAYGEQLSSAVVDTDDMKRPAAPARLRETALG